MDTIEVSKDTAIKDCVTSLNLINYQVAELLRIKEELELRLSSLLDHPEEKQKTYTVDKFSVIVSTGYIYSLDKDEYEAIGSRLPDEFNPVKIRTSFDLDKKIIHEAEKYASSEDLNVLSQIISKKPKKLHVRITSSH